MRVLAIRGRNLASLAGDFELRFDTGPLAEAGLFAICGPTGAGKSTLLDALCLALYDRTPRLGERGSVSLGDSDKAQHNDVRRIMTRFHAEALAEVDFAGQGGKSYRARWSVRRARLSVNGPLQKVEMALFPLNEAGEEGPALGDKKQDTLDRIEVLIGLSFDQFRRSVLLAQGEFAAFLKANSKERAELLERMTGTEIYGSISQAAYRRQKQQEKKLAELQARCSGMALLPLEERLEIIEERKSLKRQGRALEAEQSELNSAATWHERQEEWSAGLRSARAALTAQLDLPEPDAPQDAVLQEAGHVQARVLRKRHEQALLHAQETSRLSASLLVARARIEELSALQKAKAEKHREALLRLKIESAALAELDTWLSEHAGRSTLVEAWELTADRLRRHNATALADRNAQEARASLQETMALQGAAERTRREADEALGKRLRAAEKQVQTLATTVDAAHPSQVRDTLETLQAQEHGHAQLAELGSRLQAERDAATLLKGEEKGLRKLVQEATALEKRSRDQEAETKQAWKVAEEVYDILQLQVGLEQHRHGLVDGEACPLCGAEEHPHAGRTFDGPLTEAQTRREEQHAEHQRAEQRLKEHAGVLVEQRLGLQGKTALLEQATTRDVELLSQWSQARTAIGVSTLAEQWSTALADQVRELQAGLAKQHKAAQAELETFGQVEKQLREASRERELAAKEREEATTQLVELERERVRNEARLAALKEELERHAEELESARKNLEPILGARDTWLPKALADSSGYLNNLTAHVEEYRGKQQASLHAAQRAAEADKVIHRTNLEAKPLEEQRQRAAKELTADETSLDKFQVLLTEALQGCADPESLLADLLGPLERSLQTLGTSSKGLDEHQSSKPEELAPAALSEDEQAPATPLTQLELIKALLQDLRNQARTLAESSGKLGAKLESDQNARDKQAGLLERIDAQETAGKPWNTLNELLGSANGSRLREFAQGLTLDAVLQEANLRLKNLAPRYSLERIPGESLELRVIDREMADEIRPIRSLSGGESFLTSLALALGLSALSSRRTRIESLFIDEGFGTLDPATLDLALSTLEALQGEDRRVGIISHAAGMADRVSARVEITRLGNGYSSVEVHGS